MPRAFPIRQICAVQVVSSAAWTDDFCHSGGSFWPFPHEGLPTVGGLLRAGSPASWCMMVDGHARVHNGAASLVGPRFLDQGVPMGSALTRKVILTDTRLLGGIYEGPAVRGRWSEKLAWSHIHFLELSAVFLSLKRFFFLSLRERHVLVRTDGMTALPYLNRRWFPFTSVTQVTFSLLENGGRIMNTGSDLLSRGAPVYKDWALHPEIVAMIWTLVDLFTSRKNVQ